MGITGLLPLLAGVTHDENIRMYSGKTIALDAYCFLHKVAASLSSDAYESSSNTLLPKALYTICRSIVAACGPKTKLIMVFDGAGMPQKRNEEAQRSRDREQAYQDALLAKKLGDNNKAEVLFKRSIRITKKVVSNSFSYLTSAGVTCICAPYEADGMLSWLSRAGIADLVITEDSDLILLGCVTLMYKYNSKTGMGKTIRWKDVIENDTLPLHFSEGPYGNEAGKIFSEGLDKSEYNLSDCIYWLPVPPFIGCCLLGGNSDYTHSTVSLTDGVEKYKAQPKGIGLKTAAKRINSEILAPTKKGKFDLCTCATMRVALQIQERCAEYNVDRNYLLLFVKAYLCFLYQRIYNTASSSMDTLTPIRVPKCKDPNKIYIDDVIMEIERQFRALEGESCESIKSIKDIGFLGPLIQDENLLYKIVIKGSIDPRSLDHFDANERIKVKRDEALHVSKPVMDVIKLNKDYETWIRTNQILGTLPLLHKTEASCTTPVVKRGEKVLSIVKRLNPLILNHSGKSKLRSASVSSPLSQASSQSALSPCPSYPVMATVTEIFNSQSGNTQDEANENSLTKSDGNLFHKSIPSRREASLREISSKTPPDLELHSAPSKSTDLEDFSDVNNLTRFMYTP